MKDRYRRFFACHHTHSNVSFAGRAVMILPAFSYPQILHNRFALVIKENIRAGHQLFPILRKLGVLTRVFGLPLLKIPDYCKRRLRTRVFQQFRMKLPTSVKALQGPVLLALLVRSENVCGIIAQKVRLNIDRTLYGLRHL